MNIGILACGEIGFFCLSELFNSYKISFIMTDSHSSSIIDFCNKNNVPIFKGNPRNGNASSFISEKEIDFLVSINYLFIIDKELIHLPKKLAFNIHGSLLPKYRGRTPHVWSIINNEKKMGVTAHVIDESCDSGDIISQIEVPINSSDTGATILNKYKSRYVPMINGVISDYVNGKISYIPQNHKKATYFGKRSPEDGMINWDWQKERIFNWVRAQAYPYPGAYSYLNKNKIIIDHIEFDDYGFQQDMSNGLIITDDPVRVKTPNGVIVLSKIREGAGVIKKGQVFSNEN